MMKFPFEDPRAHKLNEMIFETIYHAAMEASVELAMIDGPYESFKGLHSLKESSSLTFGKRSRALIDMTGRN